MNKSIIIFIISVYINVCSSVYNNWANLPIDNKIQILDCFFLYADKKDINNFIYSSKLSKELVLYYLHKKPINSCHWKILSGLLKLYKIKFQAIGEEQTLQIKHTDNLLIALLNNNMIKFIDLKSEKISYFSAELNMLGFIVSKDEKYILTCHKNNIINIYELDNFSKKCSVKYSEIDKIMDCGIFNNSDYMYIQTYDKIVVLDISNRLQNIYETNIDHSNISFYIAYNFFIIINKARKNIKIYNLETKSEELDINYQIYRLREKELFVINKVGTNDSCNLSVDCYDLSNKLQLNSFEVPISLTLHEKDARNGQYICFPVLLQNVNIKELCVNSSDDLICIRYQYKLSYLKSTFLCVNLSCANLYKAICVFDIKNKKFIIDSSCKLGLLQCMNFKKDNLIAVKCNSDLQLVHNGFAYFDFKNNSVAYIYNQLYYEKFVFLPDSDLVFCISKDLCGSKRYYISLYDLKNYKILYNTTLIGSMKDIFLDKENKYLVVINEIDLNGQVTYDAYKINIQDAIDYILKPKLKSNQNCECAIL